MYLSHLMIDVGTNPDRPRPGRLWLRNGYHVHQRLCMGFPSTARVQDDPMFLKPYTTDDFPENHPTVDKTAEKVGVDVLKHVHTPRNSESGFLYRIDPLQGASTVIIVLSAVKPDWDYAFQNAGMFLAAKPETREYNPVFVAGQKLRFRIHINLSKKSSQNRIPQVRVDAQGRQRDQGRRIGITWEKGQNPEEVIVPWFSQKGAQKGFTLDTCNLLHLGRINSYPQKKEAMKFRSALLEGTLTVSEVAPFMQAVNSGIGSAKAFGFGLLSVMPHQEPSKNSKQNPTLPVIPAQAGI